MPDVHSSVTDSANTSPDVRAGLAERVRSALEAATDGTRRVIHVSVPVSDSVSPIGWIRAQQRAETAYWSGRDDARSVAGIGAADLISGDEGPFRIESLRASLDRRLCSAEGPVRYYGGLRFDTDAARRGDVSDAWTPFGTYRFVLPRFELRQTEEGTRLCCNLLCPRDRGRAEQIVEALKSLSVPSCQGTPSVPRPGRRTDVPDPSDWTQMVDWALDAIGAGTLQKVVLARRVSLDFTSSPDPFVLLHHLQDATPGCFHFAVRPRGGGVFLGASPERLFHRDGRRVISEAVAGTRARGDTESADAALREELMQSPKERREHAFVQDAIRRALTDLCTSVDGPEEPSDFALARGRHLHARLTGQLRPDTSAVDVLHSLHPTPAVGGVPSEGAMTAIREHEPFDRGWYAGPVGWVGREAAEFAVAIRSGLIRDQRLDLFSGAGLVEGSVPEREWAEIEQKIGDFAAILGIETAAGPSE